MVIEAKFDREDHSSIPAICDPEGLKIPDTRTDPESNLIGGENQKKIYKIIFRFLKCFAKNLKLELIKTITRSSI
jgi:hypothetical protein